MSFASAVDAAVSRADEGISVSALVRELLPLESVVHGDPRAMIFGVHQDSRRVRAGDLFVARKGVTTDGARFILDVRARGATAVLAARGTVTGDLGMTIVEVADVDRALALAAAAVYGHPSFGLEVVGVTGTNGKTTTTHLIAAAIDAAERTPRCGLIGTLGCRFGSFRADSALTTPESDDIARVLFAMRGRGATHVAMEVSSIALAVGRVSAVRFAVAALTNLTHDHLDFHRTMEAYGEAKASLFLGHTPGTAVVCIDGSFGAEVAKRVTARLLTVSSRVGAQADVAPSHLELSARGISMRVRTPRGPVAITSPLVGVHNVENLVTAMGVILALGRDPHDAARAFAEARGAPGRLERCDDPTDDVAVFVDYAHTPDALTRVLDAMRAVSEGRLICIFGCGGDRDKKKRGPMGRAVAERADVVIITNDNPRTEDPRAILEPIERGVRFVGLGAREIGNDLERGSYAVELDRARAIRATICAAAPGDVILIAGKGHENHQTVGSEAIPFDDRDHARRALVARRQGAHS